ncbi:DUF1491 family protein [Mesobacterium sp. TK19101]|uniref:DUF1491 family protein n=1 Tax=Mesobacterium hydrothermale TaxID=3111907 RepID=A0ABU6HHD7_9RHOB|nr:DUF1491 family protein [Mesobacterium sp. TK19101]MEC3861872.1 DUF1491 family protein [Mesobacterium sp. TK19101]
MRVTARIWVDAYLLRLRLLNIPAFVVSHGNDLAGSVLVKLNTLDGQARVFTRRFDFLKDARVWDVLAEGDEASVDASIAAQRRMDPDLWFIEVEDRAGRHLLDDPGLAEG